MPLDVDTKNMLQLGCRNDDASTRDWTFPKFRFFDWPIEISLWKAPRIATFTNYHTFSYQSSTILPEAVQNELMTLWDIKSTTKPKRRMPRSKLTRPTNKARVDAPAKRSSSPSRFTASRAWPVNKLISAVGPTWSCRRVPGWFMNRTRSRGTTMPMNNMGVS